MTKNSEQDTTRQTNGLQKNKKAAPKTLKRRRKKTILNEEQIINELASIGFASIADLCRWDSNGLELLDSSDMRSQQLSAIAEVREDISSKGVRSGVRLKMHKKIKALELLGKHLGMFQRDVAEANNGYDINKPGAKSITDEMQSFINSLYEGNTSKEGNHEEQSVQ